jgi:NAD(P)-dependent dehydrogenase (short-subunit alcohol dehydrogenase family)
MSKRVIIAGASGNLGSVVRSGFEQAGWRIATLDRSSGADLSSGDGARRAVEAAASQLGGAEALVHLVGGFASAGPITKTPDDVWNQMWALNFNTALYTLRAVLPLMQGSGFGRVVLTGSLSGVNPPAGLSAYAVSKAALHALVRVAAAEMAGKGVTVNAILPGTIDTPANRKAMPDADRSMWVAPEAICSLLLWLASPEAGDMNGALLPLSGGA